LVPGENFCTIRYFLYKMILSFAMWYCLLQCGTFFTIWTILPIKTSLHSRNNYTCEPDQGGYFTDGGERLKTAGGHHSGSWGRITWKSQWEKRNNRNRESKPIYNIFLKQLQGIQVNRFFVISWLWCLHDIFLVLKSCCCSLYSSLPKCWWQFHKKVCWFYVKCI